ncbi:MAG: ABC transporter permease [Candidatus Omnitrophica bacterium]|nr:ABC transporter permease [Candidatus Omnitrophota bacterium]
MTHVPMLIRRELASYWFSPIAYVILAVFMVINGWTFWILTTALNNPSFTMTGSVMQIFFGGTFFFWFCLILICPAITMRLFSEERRLGTIEMLMTAPVREWEIVMGKFLGAWIFYALLWAPTLFYMFVLRAHTSVDMGPVWSGYIGTLLAGGVLLSIGVFASALTSNQIVAAVVAFAVILLLFSFGLVGLLLQGEEMQGFISYVSILNHFSEFSKGIIDTRRIAFYASLIIVNLLGAIWVLESQRWR